MLVLKGIYSNVTNQHHFYGYCSMNEFTRSEKLGLHIPVAVGIYLLVYFGLLVIITLRFLSLRPCSISFGVANLCGSQVK